MASKPHLDFHGNTLKSREVAGFALREIFHQPGVFIPKHSHENAHVGFILNGAFTEKFERKVLECKPLSVSYLSPGLTHTDDFRHGVHCLVFEIAPRRLERVRQLLTLREPIFVHGGQAAWLTMRLYHEARRTDEASSLAVEGLALEILAELSRQHANPPEGKPPRWLEQGAGSSSRTISGNLNARRRGETGRRSSRSSSHRLSPAFWLHDWRVRSEIAN
jgi:AraC family transcriptional regulator